MRLYDEAAAPNAISFDELRDSWLAMPTAFIGDHSTRIIFNQPRALSIQLIDHTTEARRESSVSQREAET
jgi:hypothetical protein